MKITNENIEFDETLKVEDSIMYKHLKLVICNNDDKTFENISYLLSRIRQPYNFYQHINCLNL